MSFCPDLSQHSQGYWYCGYCNYHNKATRNACNRCKEPKFIEEYSPVPSTVIPILYNPSSLPPYLSSLSPPPAPLSNPHSLPPLPAVTLPVPSVTPLDPLPPPSLATPLSSNFYTYQDNYGFSNNSPFDPLSLHDPLSPSVISTPPSSPPVPAVAAAGLASTEQIEVEDPTSEEACNICATYVKNSVFLHGLTAHRAACYECALQCEDLCPVCREPIERIVKLF